MTLQLVRLRPDVGAFKRWSYQHRLLGSGIDDGYAWHALLKAVLGDLAPQPFVVRSKGGGNAELLAYTDSDTCQWQPLGQDGDALRAIRLDTLESRSFPASFSRGDALSFEVRVRPIVRARTGREHSHELDAAVHARKQDPQIDRETAYVRWLQGELARLDAAELVALPRLVRFLRARVLRKDRGGSQVRSQTVEGPDALFRGQLRVSDPDGFLALVRRGLGRHRAFGFGCLLLAPPGALR